MSIIDSFIDQYSREYDYYNELSRIAASKIENEINSRGLKAIVSFRAKKLARLKEKIEKRNEEKKYKTIDEIKTDLVDLAGVRVALYFPSERDIIGEIVSDIFEVIEEKIFPSSKHIPSLKKRFSGYWATHYRIQLKPEKSLKRYQNSLVEIQVASVLMHAWAEVEHDLVYKPLSGKLSEEELAILDEINGMVISGEIALERLQKAMAERTRAKNNFQNKYELTNFILSNLDKNHLDKLKLGNINIINNYLRNISNINTSSFYKYLTKVNKNINESISDQLFNIMLEDNVLNQKDFYKTYKEFISKIEKPNRSGFEKFLKMWILLEKAMNEFTKDQRSRRKKYVLMNYDQFVENNILTKKEVGILNHFRNVRNNLIHGIESPNNNYLLECSNELKPVLLKIIKAIPNLEMQKLLLKEVNEL